MKAKAAQFTRAKQALHKEYTPAIRALGLHLGVGGDSPVLVVLCQSHTRKPPGHKLQAKARNILGTSFEFEDTHYEVKIRFMGMVVAHEN